MILTLDTGVPWYPRNHKTKNPIHKFKKLRSLDGEDIVKDTDIQYTKSWVLRNCSLQHREQMMLNSKDFEAEGTLRKRYNEIKQ